MRCTWGQIDLLDVSWGHFLGKNPIGRTNIKSDLLRTLQFRFLKTLMGRSLERQKIEKLPMYYACMSCFSLETNNAYCKRVKLPASQTHTHKKTHQDGGQHFSTTSKADGYFTQESCKFREQDGSS